MAKNFEKPKDKTARVVCSQGKIRSVATIMDRILLINATATIDEDCAQDFHVVDDDKIQVMLRTPCDMIGLRFDLSALREFVARGTEMLNQFDMLPSPQDSATERQ